MGVFAAGCGATRLPTGTRTAYEAEAREAQCDEIDAESYYSVRPIAVRPIAQRETVGGGLFGISLNIGHDYEPDVFVGIDQEGHAQVTEWRSWPASRGFATDMLVQTDDDPLYQRLIRVRLGSHGGDLDAASVHICDLLANHRVDLAQGGSIEFEVIKGAHPRLELAAR
jgi:hypothetical protein